MYLRYALERCAELEAKAATIYASLERLQLSVPELAKRWGELAERASSRSRMVSAVVAVHNVDDDYGPFLVEIPEHIEAVNRALEEILRQVQPGISPRAALKYARTIEDSGLHEMTREIIGLSLPRIKAFSRRLTSNRTAWNNSALLSELEQLGAPSAQPPQNRRAKTTPAVTADACQYFSRRGDRRLFWLPRPPYRQW